MNVHMDATYAAALRATLVEQVNRSRVSSRRRRWRYGGAGLLALAVAGGGTAFAAGAFRGLPGSNAVTQVASAVTVVGTGTRSVDLGRPPANANSITMRLTCLTAGTFGFSDGASVTCSQQDLGTPTAVTTYTVPVRLGQTTTTITASPGEHWRLTASYAHVTTTPWAVNAHGQTYGVVNSRGIPDLIAAVATNGKIGYIYASQVAHAEGPMPTSPQQALEQQAHPKPAVRIPVYLSDGFTIIGQFVVGGGTGTPVLTSATPTASR
ncbi:MAG: hypothetical protein ACRDRL_04145 [Sciscionella sp.]